MLEKLPWASQPTACITATFVRKKNVIIVIGDWEKRSQYND